VPSTKLGIVIAVLLANVTTVLPTATRVPARIDAVSFPVLINATVVGSDLMSGSDARAKINFGRNGLKELALAIAKLETA